MQLGAEVRTARLEEVKAEAGAIRDLTLKNYAEALRIERSAADPRGAAATLAVNCFHAGTPGGTIYTGLLANGLGSIEDDDRPEVW